MIFPSIMAAAEAELARFPKPSDKSPRDHNSFYLGIEWLLEHLLSLSEKEFDERAVRLSKPNQGCAFCWSESSYVEGARHQHALMFARLMQARELLERQKSVSTQMCNERNEAREEIAQLKGSLIDSAPPYYRLWEAERAKVKELEAEVERLKDDWSKSDCDRLAQMQTYTDWARDAEIERDQLKAKVERYEKALNMIKSEAVEAEKNGCNLTRKWIFELIRQALDDGGGG